MEGEDRQAGGQGGGVKGMFWGVAEPYGQHETDSKIVTANGTP